MIIRTFLSSTLLCLFCGLLSACGGGKNPDTTVRPQGGDKGGDTTGHSLFQLGIVILDGEKTLMFHNDLVSGVGLFRFTPPLVKRASSYNFEVGFVLDDGGSLTLITHARDDLTQGHRITWSRPRGSTKLQGLIETPEETDTFDTELGNKDSTTTLTFSVDVHNDHSGHTHFVIGLTRAGEKLFDKLLDGEGLGANWGLSLGGATVFRARNSEPGWPH